MGQHSYYTQIRYARLTFLHDAGHGVHFQYTMELLENEKNITFDFNISYDYLNW